MIYKSFVIPAKAGIHHLPFKFTRPEMDPRLRGGDGWFLFEIVALNDGIDFE